MKNLAFFAVAILVIWACNPADDPVDEPDLRDTAQLEVTSHSLLDSFQRGQEIVWNASDRTDYTYSVRIAPVNTNDEDSIWAALKDNAVFSQKGMTENKVSFQNPTKDQYLAVLVVKHPNSTSFKDWMATISDDELNQYVTTTILIGDGRMRAGTGCVICCDTGSHTCDDGTVMTCKCVNNFCWKKLCPATSKLEPIPEI